MSIEVRHVCKSFGGVPALRDVSLAIPDGRLTALLGPSGCGKTTLLRIIAGLDVPDDAPGAAILFQNADVAGRDPRDRQVGFVFQHYALFRHMTVAQNIAFGLAVRPRRTRPPGAEIHARVSKLIRLIQMEGMEGRYPRELSGGQRQRVALARALAVEPQVLLLDEPFGALDAKVREELRQWLRRLHDEIRLTSVFVTHDQEEAMEVADRVVVMNRGAIEQEGTPDEIFHRPATEFVMRFIGRVNLFHSRLDAAGAVSARRTSERVYVRPHEMDVSRERPDAAALAATVVRVLSAAPQVKIDLRAENGEPVQAELSHERYGALQLREGERAWVFPRRVRAFRGAGGSRSET